jgi:tetraacyldisaccharide 4'-kinase
MGVKNFLRIWLSPYAWVLGVRHFLYDTGIIPSREFPQVPIICVGNLAAGGTGKTPMTEYLVELLLQNGKRPMVLSRGYGRKTKGFHYVEPHGEAGAHLLWGDEPLQIKYRFPGVVVAVCEDRVAGVERLLADYPEDPWILLDDAMQHRRLKPSKTILMSNYNRPYWKDRLLPFGRLRDLPSAARRADCLVLTHCPSPPHSSPLTSHPSPLTLRPSPNLPHLHVLRTALQAWGRSLGLHA